MTNLKIAWRKFWRKVRFALGVPTGVDYMEHWGELAVKGYAEGMRRGAERMNKK